MNERYYAHEPEDFDAMMAAIGVQKMKPILLAPGFGERRLARDVLKSEKPMPDNMLAALNRGSRKRGS